MVKHSSSTSASGPLNHWSAVNASLRLLFPRDQRGVSGMVYMKMTSNAAGIAPMRASHRQLTMAPMTYESKRPPVTASWLTEPSMPRRRAGTISAIYTYYKKNNKIKKSLTSPLCMIVHFMTNLSMGLLPTCLGLFFVFTCRHLFTW